MTVKRQEDPWIGSLLSAAGRGRNPPLHSPGLSLGTRGAGGGSPKAPSSNHNPDSLWPDLCKHAERMVNRLGMTPAQGDDREMYEYETDAGVKTYNGCTNISDES